MTTCYCVPASHGKNKFKMMAEMEEELRLKLEGDFGEIGLELEDRKAGGDEEGRGGVGGLRRIFFD